jgi:hypothetical protein
MEQTPHTQEFEVECSICRTRYKNHVGSTECCGALAFLVKDDKVSDEATIYSATPGQGIVPTTLRISKK